MALTITTDASQDNIVGSKRNRHAEVVLDNSYPIGGYAVSADDFGLVVLERFIFEGPAVDPDTADNALVANFDKANGRLQFFWAADGGSADGPLVEVANQTDVSAYTLRAIAVGY